MLDQFFHTGVPLGLAQATAAALLAFLTVWVARRGGIHVERETAVAIVRGLIQIVAVGSVLTLVFQGPGWISGLVLAGMMVAAGAIAARRTRGLPGAFGVSLAGIAAGGGLVIVVMTLLGVIDEAMTSLIPVGSMLIANAMNTNALALERFRSEVEHRAGMVEARLTLGASPSVAVRPHVQAAVSAALIPRIDSLRSLGIVWIPGLMAGMIIAGADPVYAAIYQFAVIAMIYASSGLTAVISTLLIRAKVFGSGDRLVLPADSSR
jgi:putative ABC transport system permease protein